MNEVFASPVNVDITPNQASTTNNNAERVESSVPVPFSLYSDVNNKTYTEKFFELDGADKANIGEVERFVMEQIQERGLKNTTEVYDRILEEIFGKLGIDKDEENFNKFFKTHTYIKMLGKMELLKSLQESESIDEKIAKLLERRNK
jgi:hypothetical protein